MEKKSSKEILPEKERKLSVADWSELNKVLPLTQKYEQALESAEKEIEELKKEIEFLKSLPSVQAAEKWRALQNLHKEK